MQRDTIRTAREALDRERYEADLAEGALARLATQHPSFERAIRRDWPTLAAWARATLRQD